MTLQVQMHRPQVFCGLLWLFVVFYHCFMPKNDRKQRQIHAMKGPRTSDVSACCCWRTFRVEALQVVQLIKEKGLGCSVFKWMVIQFMDSLILDICLIDHQIK